MTIHVRGRFASSSRTDLVLFKACFSPLSCTGTPKMDFRHRLIILILIVLWAFECPPSANAQPTSASATEGSGSGSSGMFQTTAGERQCCGEPVGLFDGQGCLSDRQTLTGDWWGGRTLLEDSGVTFDGVLTQFYQGVTDGGLAQHPRYGGHGDYELGFDFGKLCDAEGLSLQLGSEHRFGQSANSDTGSSVPVALLMNLPERDTTHLALTKVLFTQAFSEQSRIFFGKIDTLEFDRNDFSGGIGRDRFFTTAFNYNPVATRTVPFSALGAGIAIGDEEDPFFVFTVINPEDTATTSGLSTLFAEGVAMFAELRVPTQLFGRSGHQGFGGSWSSRTYTSLNQSQRLEFPDLPIAEVDGSWSLFWNADQHIWEDPCDPERGWGIFSRAGISDGNPNPVEWFVSFGIGGSSPIASRRDDTFGVGWYYMGISDKLGPLVSTLLTDGQGIELYYSIAVTECITVTPDLQISEPNLVTTKTAIIPGIRARIEF